MSVDQYRFYEREFPESNELVMVKVNDIQIYIRWVLIRWHVWSRIWELMFNC